MVNKIGNNRINISLVKELTKNEYFVRGRTSLLDAIGKTIEFMGKNKNASTLLIIGS